MKHSITALLVLLITSCSMNYHQAQSDYQLKTNPSGDSFYIVAHPSMDPQVRSVIERGIFRKMETLGYSYAENGELIINYEIYEGTFNLKTLNQTSSPSKMGTQPSIHTYSKKIKLDGPVLYISMYQREQGDVVWRGYTESPLDHAREIQARVQLVMNGFLPEDNLPILARNLNSMPTALSLPSDQQ